MEVRFSPIMRNIFTQINFSTSTKNSKVYVKKMWVFFIAILLLVTLLQHGILNTVMFIRSAWQISPMSLEM
ncbi:unnamed protein product [Hymenolepis diminuta]|uniref:Uncharacterized protein n=1 Tax=Hymenolepis diminuta TaxID=6216 RepID=A0A564ZCE8_HYMDI|nr:unnamed protein product [Hymenolepis diminuta]